ncbi:MAG: rod shape-determining protein MreC [Rickettsiales bacterium]|jgi:rod shape-determining protein MreC|nr:rod shape-determining protein MreC [Rickettsiales bacterium]
MVKPPVYRKKTGPIGFYWSVGYRIQMAVSRLSFSFLFILSISLLVYCRTNRDMENGIRTLVSKHLRPFVYLTRGVSAILAEGGEKFVSLWYLDRRNAELARENSNLRLKLFEFDRIRNENNSLREVLNFVSRNRIDRYMVKKIDLVSTRGVTHCARILLSGEEANNIAEHDLVLDRQGSLVGRVVNIHGEAAEIMLVSDYRSKIPANLETSGLKVILSGNGTNLLDIGYFFNNGSDALLDENVYTSNDGDILQDGIIVGKIVRTGKKLSVKLDSSIGLLDFVVIVQRNPR